MNLKILLKKEIANAFAQRKYIYMIIAMSIGFPIVIPMIDNNGLLDVLIPASLMATIIPNIIALTCSSQLVANSHIEEVKSNISRTLLYRRIKRSIFLASKIIIPFIIGFISSMLSSIVFHYTSGPLSADEFLLVAIANVIWSLLPVTITLLLTILKFDNDVTLNLTMVIVSYIVYGGIIYVADPFSNIVSNVLISILFFITIIIICSVLISKSIPKLEVNVNNGK